MTLEELVIQQGIDRDIEYAKGLVLDNRAIEDSGMASITLLCLAPYLSLYVYESSKKLRTVDSFQIENLSATVEPIVARSRHSLKLFDDNKRGIEGQLAYFRNEILAPHGAMFRGKNLFTRLLGDDLGIFRYNNRIIGTTHSISFNSGIDSAVLLSLDRTAIKGIYEEYGHYFGALGTRLGVPGETFVRRLDSQAFSPREEDVRSGRYYRKVFDGPGNPDLNALLTFFQGLMNFAELITSNSGVPEYSAFKIRFLTLYQVLTSLHMLRTDQGQTLTARSTKILTSLVEAAETQLLLSRPARSLRNTLTHYNLVQPIDSTRVDVVQPLFGLVPIYFPAHTAESFVALVNGHLAAVAARLDEWSGPM
ncbi:hypothetical protein ACLQ25_31340 [Micromonospora sp. DT44]|uniref:hypothetical protein n=1 Tax=Micromonospora sp. DT44 TaxID=3393439 RepID=UPI003CF1EFF7